MHTEFWWGYLKVDHLEYLGKGRRMVLKWNSKYRVSIKSFPEYKHLLQENYVEYKHIFCNITINT